MRKYKRCIYCHSETSSLRKVLVSEKSNMGSYYCCCEDCRKKAGRYFLYIHRGIPFFLILLLPCVLIMLGYGIGITDIHQIADIAGMIVGILFLVFPYLTSFFLEKFGIRDGRLIFRILGGLLVLLSLSIFLGILG